MRHAAAGSLWACLLGLAISAPALGEPSPFPVQGLSVAQRRALHEGRTVPLALSFEQDGGHYVGGVSYQVVDAPPELVLATLSDVQNWPEALPRTKSARLLPSTDGLSRVELVQGGPFVDARYTVVLQRTENDTIRFWLDSAQPHDIRDVWGFFRVRPLPEGRALITVGAALDVGDGLPRLFEEKIAGMVLRTPTQIRDFLEPRVLAFSR